MALENGQGDADADVETDGAAAAADLARLFSPGVAGGFGLVRDRNEYREIIVVKGAVVLLCCDFDLGIEKDEAISLSPGPTLGTAVPSLKNAVVIKN